MAGQRVDAMMECLSLKRMQHYNPVMAFLDDTGDMPIVEKSLRDDFWGAKPVGDKLVGENVLGELWMILRGEG